MRKFFTVAALAVVAIAAPAMAQQNDPPEEQSRTRDIGSRIDRMHDRIERAERRGTISPGEAEALHDEADAIAELHEDDRGGGFDSGGRRELAQRMRALRERLRHEPRDDAILHGDDRGSGQRRMMGGDRRYGDQRWDEDAEWSGVRRNDDRLGDYPRQDDSWDAAPQGADDPYEEQGWDRDRGDNDPSGRMYEPSQEADPYLYDDTMPPD